MRIVCPRCVAQYEVDESAIPETGREVQCANCENIWFQDYIEMLPTADDTDVPEEEDRGVFDDLDGKSEASFYSDRGTGPDADAAKTPDDFEDIDDEFDNLEEDLDDDFDDLDDDDDEPATNIPVPPVNEDVLDVLRSEAAFASARDQLDAAAADALDGDGEAMKSAFDDDEAEDAEPVLDELDAFLDAHVEEEPEDLSEDASEDFEDVEADPGFDPLADLDAIRSQLNDIGAEQSETSEYEPNLPPDDPIETVTEDATEAADDIIDDIEEALDDDQDSEPEYDAPEFDAAALSAALDIRGADDTAEEDDDDFDDEEDGTRHAYRADGAVADVEDAAQDAAQDVADDIEDTVEEDIDEAEADLAAALSGLSGGTSDDVVEDRSEDVSEDVEDDDSSIASVATAAAAATGVAAAVGMTRPRASGARTRARTLPGFDEAPKPTEAPDLPADDIASAIDDAMDDVADKIDLPDVEEDIAAAVDTDRKADPNRRPKADRKAMLPDVDELDASLRSESEEPRRRDREMREAHEEEITKASKGGFRRAFIWTLFIIALLIALYVLRPQLVAALPPAAYVLDPYAAAIDGIRGLINGLLG